MPLYAVVSGRPLLPVASEAKVRYFAENWVFFNKTVYHGYMIFLKMGVFLTNRRTCS